MAVEVEQQQGKEGGAERMAGAVVAAVMAENEWRTSDLEKADDEMGQDLIRAIRAAGMCLNVPMYVL